MHLAQNWRLRGVRYSLKTKHCTHCGKFTSPSHRLCGDCQPEAVEHYTLNAANIRVIGFPAVQFANDDVRQAAR